MRKNIIISLIVLFFLSSAIPAFAYDSRYLFTDQEKDSESGLYNFDAREYNPNTGRFLQQDPILKDGELNSFFLKPKNKDKLEKILMDPQSLNSYSYVKNNPIKYVDPNGEFAVPFIALGLVIFSGLFLQDINTAYSPAVNSTPQTIKTQNFSDIVPGLREIPKPLRFIGGLFLGVGNLTNKIESKIGSRLASKVENAIDGKFVTFYRGIANPDKYDNIIENGFKGSIWVTTDFSEALSYAKRYILDNDSVVKIRLPIELVKKIIDKNLMREGSHGEEYKVFSEGVEILNNFINN